LARHLLHVMARPADAEAMRRRWDSVKHRFSWDTLAPRYRQMFEHAAHAPLAGLANASASTPSLSILDRTT
jgi:hypothetical protein